MGYQLWYHPVSVRNEQGYVIGRAWFSMFTGKTGFVNSITYDNGYESIRFRIPNSMLWLAYHVIKPERKTLLRTTFHDEKLKYLFLNHKCKPCRIDYIAEIAVKPGKPPKRNISAAPSAKAITGEPHA